MTDSTKQGEIALDVVCLKRSIESPRITLPPGLTAEEKREFMIEVGKAAPVESEDFPLPSCPMRPDGDGPCEACQ